MNLGNWVAANILGTQERANWKHCLLTEAEEERLAGQFRTDFEPFDFTLG